MATIINYKINQNKFFCMISLNHPVGRYRPKAVIANTRKNRHFYHPPEDITMKKSFALATLAVAALNTHAETVGDVSTTFRWIGANNKIVVDVFDDPKVNGVACYLSHAKTGGVKGSLGIAEDTADAAVACRQVGPIAFIGTFPREEEVFSERSSFLFKHVRVVRMADQKRNTLVYLVYSDRVIEGSPKNSVTAVPVPANQPLPVK
jgi:CreA protein